MKKPKESRRRFLKNVTGLSAIAIANPQSLAAEVMPQQPVQQQEKPASPTQAQLLGEIVRQRYGQYLTPDQLTSVINNLDGAVQRGRRLREFKLKNSDEPDFVFSVLE